MKKLEDQPQTQDNNGQKVHSKLGGIDRGARSARTILVIDDEELVRNFSAAVLRDCGYSVMTAANGLEALDIFEKKIQRVEMLFTDIAMPVMDGLELARRVRTWHPKLPILFTSGHVESHPLEAELIPGQVEFIQKPFGVDALAGKVGALFACLV